MDKYYLNNTEKVKAASKEWTANNRERSREIKATWRRNNLEKAREIEAISRAKTKQQKAEYQRKYRLENPGTAAALCAKRRFSKKNATPKWLSKEQLLEIDQFYIEAKELEWLSDEALTVDHIVPLQGKNVSGLHVPWNLQILPHSLNCKKGNKHGSD